MTIDSGAGQSPLPDATNAAFNQIVQETAGQALTPDDRAGPVQKDPGMTHTYPDGTTRHLTVDEMETISVLMRHRGVFGCNGDTLFSNIDKPETPPDLVAALKKLRDNPNLNYVVDTADRQGGGQDNYFDGDDINAIANWPEMQAFNENQAKSFEANYVPSDASADTRTVRPMTANDAMREFYLYSDYLPEDISLEMLKHVVDLNAGCSKCPPQVLAAAQYFRDHPEAFKPLIAKNARRAEMLDAIAGNVTLNEAEYETVDVIDQNRDVFFKNDGLMNRDSLKKLTEDPDSSAAVKHAASQLLNDPPLLGMIDNARFGHIPSNDNEVDDDKSSTIDFDQFLQQNGTRNKKPPVVPAGHVPQDGIGIAALASMQAGTIDDPEIKEKKGGNKILAILRKIADVLLRIGAEILHVVSMALSAFSKIPIIGQIASGLSLAAEAAAGGLEIASTALNHGDLAKAAERFAMGMSGAALGILIAPGAGAALLKGLEKVAVIAGEKAGTSAMASGVTRAIGKSVETASAAIDKVERAGTAITNKIDNAITNVTNKVSNQVDGVLTRVGNKVASKVDNIAGKVGTSTAGAVKKTSGSAAQHASKEEAGLTLESLGKEMKDAAKDDLTDQATAQAQAQAQEAFERRKHRQDHAAVADQPATVSLWQPAAAAHAA